MLPDELCQFRMGLDKLIERILCITRHPTLAAFGWGHVHFQIEHVVVCHHIVAI